MPIRVQMPNRTVRPFREGTPKSSIRKAQADMLADMKASGHYDDCDFSGFDGQPKRKVTVTQDGPGGGPLKNPFQVSTPFTASPAKATDPLADAIARSLPVPKINTEIPPELLNPPKFPAPDPRTLSIAKRLYREGASFRGDENQIQAAFRDMAYAIVNRENAHMRMGRDQIEPDFLRPDQIDSIQKNADASKAWGVALESAQSALAHPEADPTNGATLFFHHNITNPQPKTPAWAKQTPATARVGITSVTTRNDNWSLNTYHDVPSETRARNRATRP